MKAAAGNSTRKYASGEVDGPDFRTLFGLVQCTPDLSELECSDCLVNMIRLIPECCDGKKGGRVLCPSCNIRFEDYRFFEPEDVSLGSPPSPPPVTTRSSDGDVTDTGGNVTYWRDGDWCCFVY